MEDDIEIIEERTLATIQVIAEVAPIPEADAIEHYRINGWWVVGKKDSHKVGDLVVYCEIDSWIPTEIASFLSKGKEPREYEGVKGERLKTIRLRGAISQGLILDPVDLGLNLDELSEDMDLTKELGIKKWEAPVPAALRGQVAGMFPTSIVPKTSQSRIQNSFRRLNPAAKAGTWEETIKLDGSSLTIFRHEGILRVCSRNLELKIEDTGNTFVDTAITYADHVADGFAYQGELCGPGIQGNPEKLSVPTFFVYDIYDIENKTYLTPEERQTALGIFPHVPVLNASAVLPGTIAEILSSAEGPSWNPDVIREGTVWKSNEVPGVSFKAISNAWLLKTGK